jgi:mitogen-activated protein kinase 1/3
MIFTESFEELDMQQVRALNLPEIWSEVLPYYNLDKKLGAGTYGTVVGATCKSSGQCVAIKHIKDFSLYDYDCCKLIREIQIMSGLEEVAKNKKSCFYPKLLDIIVP